MKNIFRITLFTIFSAVALNVNAVNIDMKYRPGSYNSRVIKNERGKTVRRKILQDIGCSVEILPMIDHRNNKQTIGAKPYKPLMATNMDAWTSGFIQDFSENGLTVEDNNPKAFQLKPYLVRLYSGARYMSIYGMMALRVEFLVGDSVVKDVNYRGYAAKTNWGNGDNEYLTAVNMAANDIVPKLAEDIIGFCQSI